MVTADKDGMLHLIRLDLKEEIFLVKAMGKGCGSNVTMAICFFIFWSMKCLVKCPTVVIRLIPTASRTVGFSFLDFHATWQIILNAKSH